MVAVVDSWITTDIQECTNAAVERVQTVFFFEAVARRLRLIAVVALGIEFLQRLSVSDCY